MFKTKSDDQVWHLLTWGEFETPVEALQAWEQQAVNYPKVEPLVRLFAIPTRRRRKSRVLVGISSQLPIE